MPWLWHSVDISGSNGLPTWVSWWLKTPFPTLAQTLELRLTGPDIDDPSTALETGALRGFGARFETLGMIKQVFDATTNLSTCAVIEDQSPSIFLNEHTGIFFSALGSCSSLKKLILIGNEEFNAPSDELFLLLAFNHQLEEFEERFSEGVGLGTLLSFCEWKLKSLRTVTDTKALRRFFEVILPMKRSLITLGVTYFDDDLVESFDLFLGFLSQFKLLECLCLDFELSPQCDGLYPEHLQSLLKAVPSLKRLEYTVSWDVYFDLPTPKELRKSNPPYWTEVSTTLMNLAGTVSKNKEQVLAFLEIMKGLHKVCEENHVELDLRWGF